MRSKEVGEYPLNKVVLHPITVRYRAFERNVDEAASAEPFSWAVENGGFMFEVISSYFFIFWEAHVQLSIFSYLFLLCCLFLT